MHIHFIRSQALSALKKLQPALPRDNLIPQLSGIHLEADAERKEVICRSPPSYASRANRCSDIK